ncbi:hypothetical protein SAMN04488515_0570 [Cognatiyoonia koreensis]|uniref:Uncharacterized protein n=1 Tax=Cognatiyoonia koreensis TaxID=364200 RepID=A0A1I0NEB4_9RHOB|nr:hypothetical protein [Cognatiyoonia koreensis]SEV99650.1 hypothetical protein SAMN04488515_0570 [Cognatiyoonia koreensis]
MTLNVCVFGNSHLAAVRDGFKRHEGRWPDLNLTFVGAHKNGLAETSCTDGILTPESEDAKFSFSRLAGLDQVDLRDTDAIVITGCGFALSRIAWLYRKARWAALPSVQSDPAPTKAWSLVSRPAFLAMATEKLTDELAGRFIRVLRQGTDVPIYLCSQPRTTTGILTVGKHSLDVLPFAINSGDAAALSDLYETAAERAGDALGVRYIAQNARTITDHVLTADPFTKGAIRLTMKGRYAQPKDDILHANATYGKVVLDQIAVAVRRDLAAR